MSAITPSTRIKYALQGASVCSVEDEELFEAIKKELYGKAYIYLSFNKPEKSVMDMQIHELTNRLKGYPQLRVQELGIIAELGSIKKFGDFMGLSIATFLQWIEAYLKSDERKEQVKVFVPQDRTLPEQTESGKEELNKRAVKYMAVECWNNFIDNKPFDDPMNFCYDFLESIGEIPFDEKEIAEAKIRAKETIRQQNLLPANDLAVHVQQKKILESLEAGSYEDKVLILAKKLLLKELFENLKTMEETPDFNKVVEK